MSVSIYEDIKSLLKQHGINWEENKPLATGIKELVIKYGDTDANVQVLKTALFTPEHLKKGTSCRVCNQHVQMYRYKINGKAAKCLISLFWLDVQSPSKIWFHVESDIGVAGTSGHWAKLRHWELIEEMPKDQNDKEKKTSGYWKITPKGRDFVRGTIKLPIYVKLYNHSSYGYDTAGGKLSSIQEALGNKFNYHELMNR